MKLQSLSATAQVQALESLRDGLTKTAVESQTKLAIFRERVQHHWESCLRYRETHHNCAQPIKDFVDWGRREFQGIGEAVVEEVMVDAVGEECVICHSAILSEETTWECDCCGSEAFHLPCLADWFGQATRTQPKHCPLCRAELYQVDGGIFSHVVVVEVEEEVGET